MLFLGQGQCAHYQKDNCTESKGIGPFIPTVLLLERLQGLMVPVEVMTCVMAHEKGQIHIMEISAKQGVNPLAVGVVSIPVAVGLNEQFILTDTQCHFGDQKGIEVAIIEWLFGIHSN
jgi:hypothetical protein